MSQQNVEPFDRFTSPAYRQLVEAAVTAMGQSVPAPANVIMTPPEAELAQLVPAYVEPQPTGRKAAKVVARIDELADMVTLYDDGIKELNEMTARVNALRDQIIARMKAVGGEQANSATVRGVEVFTLNPKNSYRTRDLQADYADLIPAYMREKVVEKFDMEAFAKDHPTIAARYQTREFRRTGGIQGLR